MNSMITKAAPYRAAEATLTAGTSAGDVTLALARQLSETYVGIFHVICKHGIQILYPASSEITYLDEDPCVDALDDGEPSVAGGEDRPTPPPSSREKFGVPRWIHREQRLTRRHRAVSAASAVRSRRDDVCRRLAQARLHALTRAELDRRVVDRFIDGLESDVVRAKDDVTLQRPVAARYACSWSALTKTSAALQPLRVRAQRQRSAMVRQNGPLVEMLARRFSGRGVADDDLVQEGTLGLMRAIDKFDPARGYRFSTYAQWWIRQCIARAVQDQGRTIRLPVHLNETLGRLRRAERQLSHELGRDPHRDEIAQVLDVTEKQVHELQQRIQRETSLQKRVGEDANAELGDLIADENADQGFETAEQRALEQHLGRALQHLDRRSRFILEARHGLHGQTPMTLSDIGKQLGVTRERVRQIEHEALERLRRTAHRQHLDEFV